MLQEETPIEEHAIRDGIIRHKIFVKRDDLYGQYPAPPLAKLRGAKVLLEELYKQGIRKIGVYDTSVSKAGQGIAFLCREFGMECIHGYPLKKGSVPAQSKVIARDILGARSVPLIAGRTPICYARLKKMVEEEGGYMLPLGLVCGETVEAVRQLAMKDTMGFPTVIVCTGTGTIATGIALGTSNSTLVYGISCGMNISLQWKRIQKLAYPYLQDNIYTNNIFLHHSGYDYYDRAETEEIPFPISPYYDAKAWHWLKKRMHMYPKPVLFWNIGV